MSSSRATSTVLLVEDTPSLARIYEEYLRKEPCTIVSVDTGRKALKAIEADLPEVVLLDLMLPDMNGLDILRRLHDQEVPVAVIVITAHGSINVAVEAMRLGAFDFLVKPFNADRLLVTVRNALERQKLSRIVDVYRNDLDRREYGGFIGSSLAMQAVYRTIESAAASKATVFITGESGSGKEVCAAAVHARGPRRGGPFMALNCGAIPRDLMESEIFGHAKGAFTGAVTNRDGAARQADRGTLFLDEICEMDLALQTKLLRFVQTGTFQKVGGNTLEEVDIRFVCATNRDPLEEVRAGRFREDLYYRLHVIPIQLPPLRERESDVVAIARHFLTLYAGEEGKSFQDFTADAIAALEGYEWPGNVRQLQNVVRNVVVLNEGGAVTPEMLPPPLNLRARPSSPPPSFPSASASPSFSSPVDSVADIRPLAEVEREAIERAIELCDGNIPQAATLLGINASTVYRKRASWR